jgi:putative hydrolase of the HAD superfamily
VQEFLEYWFKVENKVDARLLREVDQLRTAGIRSFLATNQERYRTEYISREMGLSDHFDGIFSSAFVGYLKQDRRRSPRLA